MGEFLGGQVKTDLAADEVEVRHGSGLIPFASIQAGGQRELAVRGPGLQTATPSKHKTDSDRDEKRPTCIR